MREGFFKVDERGGSYVVATFYNPTTDESFTKCVRDYDYSDGSRDDDELYYMSIDEEVRHLYLRRLGIISIGDTVKVVKGRKVPIGTIAVVVGFKDWKDRYGRVQTTYVLLDNGMKTNEDNCIIVEDI